MINSVFPEKSSQNEIFCTVFNPQEAASEGRTVKPTVIQIAVSSRSHIHEIVVDNIPSIMTPQKRIKNSNIA